MYAMFNFFPAVSKLKSVYERMNKTYIGFHRFDTLQ